MTDERGLQFVVLRHEGVDEPHFDILFETAPGSLLSAWRSPAWPPEGEQDVTRLPDHRRIYLTYEGPISGNRGHVRRIVAGECQRVEHESGGEEWRLRVSLPGLSEQQLIFHAHPGGRWSAMLT